MTWDEYLKTGYLPTIIDEYVIMHIHSRKLEAYLESQLGMYGQRIGGDWSRLYQLQGLIELFKQKLGRA